MILIFFSCENDKLINNRKDLIVIFKKANENGITEISEKDNSLLASEMRMNGIDKIVINYSPNSESFIELDSVVSFIKRSRNIFSPEKRLIYDFAKKPRRLSNEELINASYKRVQIDERWSFETIGFD